MEPIFDVASCGAGRFQACTYVLPALVERPHVPKALLLARPSVPIQPLDHCEFKSRMEIVAARPVVVCRSMRLPQDLIFRYICTCLPRLRRLCRPGILKI